MKLLIIPMLSLVLMACNSSTDEQKEFIDQIKASSTPHIESMPEMTSFEHFTYAASELRSPFVAPQPAVIESKLIQVKNCLHPDPNRRRDPLEKYPLDNLNMKGVIVKETRRWALIEASDNTLYRVESGQYMGLYNGEVKAVNVDYVELLELIPDGSGCWKERYTRVEMKDSEEDGSGT